MHTWVVIICTCNAAFILFLTSSALPSFFATAAARALVDIPDLSAEEVARKSMEIAANMCVYTNTNFRSEVIDAKEEEAEEGETKNED